MHLYFDLCAKGQKHHEILVNSSAKLGTCLGKSLYSFIFNSSVSLPTKSEVCKNKFTTNFLSFHGIDECFRRLDDICNEWKDEHGASNLLLILPAAKCIFEKQPMYDDIALWKQVACSALWAFRNETMPPLVKVVNFVDQVLGCVRPPPPPSC